MATFQFYQLFDKCFGFVVVAERQLRARQRFNVLWFQLIEAIAVIPVHPAERVAPPGTIEEEGDERGKVFVPGLA